RKEILRRFENENPEQIIPTTKHNECLLKNKTKIELPAERREHFKNQYKLDAVLCEQLCDDKNLADFFEETVKLSNAPETTARLLLQEVKRLLKISSIDTKNSNDIKNSKLTEKNFSKIIELLEKKKIHNVTTKRLIKETLENGSSPEDILTQLNLTELSSKKELLPYIQKVVKENSLICEKIKQGEISKVEYLTGLVMKETENKALPQIVKTLLKEELGMNTVYILSMGGAFSAVMHSDGIVASGDSSSIRSLAAKCAKDVPVQIISIAQFLSEELEPNDWAILIAEISRIINSSMAKGIVITHGCDTLSYTASLLFWLFSDSTIPIVLTASSELPGKSKEAEENLSLAIKTSTTKKSGVYVAFDKKLLSPLNLRFTSLSKSGFRNWNLAKPIFTKSGPIAEQFSDNSEYDKKVLERLLVDASGRMLTCKVYPGFRSDVYRKLLTNKIHSVFLELYESGAGNMRSNDFSLKPFLLYGKEKNIRFYCTSQQESNAGFTQYATSHRIWREGAVPMGSLSIESSITLYFACSLVSDTEQELDELMDTYSKLYE
ncbi:MAG: asparaginase, partial [Treponema sp.]|nr:asparaginase [Treponema sp.]